MMSLISREFDGGFILLIIFFVYGFPILSSILAIYLRKKEPTKAKIIGILTAVYVIISLGYCGII